MTLHEILDLKLGDIPQGPLVFLIIILIAFTFPWYSDIYYQARKLLFKKLTKKEQEEWAVQAHDDLLKKLLELIDDPCMSYYKWREWLPICKYSDTILRQALPKTQLTCLEEFVHQIMDEPDEIPV